MDDMACVRLLRELVERSQIASHICDAEDSDCTLLNHAAIIGQ